GVVNLVNSMAFGVKILMRSAEVYGGEETEEPSKFEKWLAEKLKIDLMSVVTTLALVLGLALSVGLFVFLPYLLSTLIAGWTQIDDEGLLFNFIEGGLRVVIFISYIALTSLMKDIRRTYMYHGAEHKTITCFEKGMPLTVENVRGCSRVHDRCGTTFMFFVMVIAILVFSVSNSLLAPIMNIENGVLDFLVRLVIKLALLPVVAGVSYELLKLLAKTQSPLVFPLKAPGLALQRLTTREPDDDMIECAIAAFERVLKMDNDRTVGESSFAVGGKLSDVKKHIDGLFARADIEGEDCQWILSLSLDVPVSKLGQERLVTAAEARKIYKLVNERLTGRPLWYIVSDTSFCGYTIKVDERVLIPRPETEILVENAVQNVKTGARILDLCTGSGAIAVAIKKICGEKNITVTAVDVSEEALSLAKENAEANQAKITFIQSDLFENIQGKFDVILSNPPYIARAEIEELQKEVKDFEPRLALDGGEDGLDFYRRIGEEFDKYLAADGFMLLELGMGQANAVKALFEQRGAKTEIIKDLAKIDRILKVTL
ncbi:MAG: peptide chain release factor N(5)-glutamine methyltransferase, partial [Clostridia bacterium]|nr:peptide chain release factor N(5)-glutamine methyltransferase [Clostridia bacterium]